MSEPNSGEYSVRSLAEILREHGLETELGTRPGRRRRTSDDPEVTGRSPRVEAPQRARPPSPAPVQSSPAAAASPARSSAPVRTPGAVPAAVRSPAAAGAQARVPVTRWPDQTTDPSRPAAGLVGPAAPVRVTTPARAEPRDDPAEGLSSTGRVGDRVDSTAPPVGPGRRKSDRSPGEPRAGKPTARSVGKDPGLFGTGPSTSAIPAVGGATASQRQAHPVTGPIPVQRSEPAEAAEEEPLTGRESALAWVRFAGELVVALAVGIGLYFAFTVLWELLPYVALVAAPVAVTTLVAGVAAWRQKTGQGVLGVRLLGALVLAGTVLVIAPAAGLLAG